MAKDCPFGKKALYLDCLECEEKLCKKKKAKHDTAVIGIDQSYKNTGISISVDGKIKSINSIDLSHLKSKSEKRAMVRSYVLRAIERCKASGVENIICVFERVRLHSQGFLSMDYIQSISGLNTTIIDTCYENGIEAFSVDTRCWKANVIGTSKPKSNKFGVQPEKWPTVEWVIANGFENKILKPVEGRRQKGTFTDKDGNKFEYDNDAADSAAISMFWFVADHKKLKREQ